MAANSKPTPVVCAIIERKGFVLLAKRPAHKHLGGKWEFPGGKVENAESPSTAIVREIREELGCEFSPRNVLPPNLHEYENITIEMIPLVGHLADSSADPICHEHDEIAWVSPSELRNYDLAPADIPVVEAYRQSLESEDKTLGKQFPEQ